MAIYVFQRCFGMESKSEDTLNKIANHPDSPTMAAKAREELARRRTSSNTQSLTSTALTVPQNSTSVTTTQKQPTSNNSGNTSPKQITSGATQKPSTSNNSGNISPKPNTLGATQKPALLPAANTTKPKGPTIAASNSKLKSAPSTTLTTPNKYNVRMQRRGNSGKIDVISQEARDRYAKLYGKGNLRRRMGRMDVKANRAEGGIFSGFLDRVNNRLDYRAAQRRGAQRTPSVAVSTNPANQGKFYFKGTNTYYNTAAERNAARQTWKEQSGRKLEQEFKVLGRKAGMQGSSTLNSMAKGAAQIAKSQGASSIAGLVTGVGGTILTNKIANRNSNTLSGMYKRAGTGTKAALIGGGLLAAKGLYDTVSGPKKDRRD